MARHTDIAVLLIEARRASNGRGARLREQAGLAQSEVAGVVGVTASAVSHWEAGRRSPRGDAALAYATLLRELEHLLAEDGSCG